MKLGALKSLVERILQAHPEAQDAVVELAAITAVETDTTAPTYVVLQGVVPTEDQTRVLMLYEEIPA